MKGVIILKLKIDHFIACVQKSNNDRRLIEMIEVL